MSPRAFGVLLGTVLLTFAAQQLLTPVLAPLSREVGLSEVQLGTVITVAAVAFTAGSLAWGNVADRWGPRRLLLTGLVLCAAGLATFALVCWWALGGTRPAGTVLVGMLLTRALLFGVGAGAVPVAVLAAVGAATSGEEQRTRAVSLVGAAQAVALVVGPGLGGVLAVADLLAPVWLAPALLVAAAGAVAVMVPRPPRAAGASTGSAGAAVRPWDARVRPFLVVGFLLFLSLGLMQVVLGFLVQDRLGLDAQDTAAQVGAAFFGTGLVLVAVQGVLVPKLRWGPARLLRVGAPIAVAGFAALALAPTFWTITLGMVVIAVGLGLAMPGYTAGSSLRVGRAEQGSVAGLVNAVNGSTFVIGPLLGTALYSVAPALPIWLGAGSCLLGCVVALASRSVSAVADDTVVRPPAPAG